MLSTIRASALRVKKTCEAYKSPIPLKVRVRLHAIARHIYHRTYGLTPAEAREIFNGKNVPTEKVLFANYCMREFGNTLNSDGTQSFHININDGALLSMLAFDALRGRWQRMLDINGVSLEPLSEIEDSDDTAERYGLPAGTKFYYLEPDEEDED